MGTSPERTKALCEAVNYIALRDLSGAFVECGVYRGGSAVTMALSLLRRGLTDRDLFLFDTFSGMPMPSEHDRDARGTSALDAMRSDESVYCRCSLEDVKRNMAATNYPRNRVHYVKGMVESSLPDSAPSEIALLRLDTDWYESTKHELIHLYPRLIPGGILIIDDYGHWQGARKAVDEYFQNVRPVPFLSRIDYTGRIAVKPNN